MKFTVGILVFAASASAWSRGGRTNSEGCHSDRKNAGYHYDILSFDTDGRERFIEVKTTAYMAETPFFVTPNELDFSSEQSRQFHLYRLFAFRRKPQMFALTGSVAANCLLEPHSYRATVIGT